MAHDNLTYDDLLRIVELIKSSEQFSEFRLKVGEVEVELRRRSGSSPAALAAPAPTPAPDGHREAASAQAPEQRPREAPPSGGVRAPSPAAADRPAWPADAIVIRSPMVGTFYRAPEPGAAPFTEVGRAVGREDIVCIIEVMKLMNSIAAGARGRVTHILVEDGASVEAGQPIIVLAPAD